VKKNIIVSTTNDISTDNRVHKVCMLLLDLGFHVLWIGRQMPNNLPLERPYMTHRMKLLFKKGALFYAEYNLRLFFILLFKRTDIFLSNDLDTLLANYLASTIKNKTLVYDSHEYFLGVPEIQNRKLVKVVWSRIERFIFPKLAYVFTVNDSIALLYEKDYGKKLMVFRNISNPPKIEKWLTRKEMNLPENAYIFINQGSGMNVDRGLEEAVDAVCGLENAVLLLVGSGDAIPELKKKVYKNGLQEKIIFIDKQPYAQLLQYTHASNCGLSLDKSTNINYKFSLPNKLFDYFFCKIPVIVSPVVEVKNIVEKSQTGLIVADVTAINIREAMKKMMSFEQNYFADNLEKVNILYNWENEQRVLRSFYSTIKN